MDTHHHPPWAQVHAGAARFTCARNMPLPTYTFSAQGCQGCLPSGVPCLRAGGGAECDVLVQCRQWHTCMCQQLAAGRPAEGQHALWVSCRLSDASSVRYRPLPAPGTAATRMAACLLACSLRLWFQDHDEEDSCGWLVMHAIYGCTREDLHCVRTLPVHALCGVGRCKPCAISLGMQLDSSGRNFCNHGLSCSAPAAAWW